ncbi:CaiB/BaiF CoA transferase family protein [Desulfosarcina ovata]|uniref:Formyl-CoA transferase n=1 Tax=Desulfosarcina ovata subsp. ovata TaxID=2752305 RepID=A0A5K8A6G8_9BACT|nr:CoA transferase [Desulfosarcina ovata]BBO88107.1 formyl-CoA transferase [Desulfosarcina ovata subsp. ovata]
MDRNNLPLKNITVCDFSWVGAGPIATNILGQFGANIIKIESRSKPEVLRKGYPFKDGKQGIERSGYFANRNPNKRSISLNMKVPEARDVVVRLIEKSDIVINNFRAGQMEKWNLGYEDVQKIKRDIIYVTMSIQGDKGPYSHSAGFGVTLNALVGFTHLTANPEGEPLGTGTSYTDHIAVPTHTLVGIMAALLNRDRTGAGQRVEVPQAQAAICLKPLDIMDYAANRRIQQPLGVRDANAAPHGVYKVLGYRKWIAIAVFSDDQWCVFKEAMGYPDWAEDDTFDTLSGRLDNQDILDQQIEKWTETQDGKQLQHRLMESGVPAGMVQDARATIEDPQLAQQDFWAYLDHPEVGITLYNKVPMRFSKTPAVMKTAAPLLGKHTREVLTDFLAYSDAEFEEMKNKKVFD